MFTPHVLYHTFNVFFFHYSSIQYIYVIHTIADYESDLHHNLTPQLKSNCEIDYKIKVIEPRVTYTDHCKDPGIEEPYIDKTDKYMFILTTISDHH